MEELEVQTIEYFAELLVDTSDESTIGELEVNTTEFFKELLVDVT